MGVLIAKEVSGGDSGPVLRFARSRAAVRPVSMGPGQDTASLSRRPLHPRCERPSPGPRRVCSGRAASVRRRAIGVRPAPTSRDGAAAGRRLLHIQANRSARRSRCWSARCSWWTIGGQNPVETGRNPGQNPSGPESLFSAFCRQKADPAVRCGSACHAEGRGFESLQPLPGMPRPGVVEVAIPLGVFDERKHDGRMPRRRRGHHKK
jgi:hypothetical protein